MARGGKQARRLKAELSRWRGLGRRYPADIKARVLAFAKVRRASGASLAALAGELGVSVMTLYGWLKASAGKRRRRAGKKPALLPVQIVPDTGVQAGRPSPVVMGPRGLRVEGLSIEEIAVLLRGLA